ncbi:MAG: hypothetical protein HY760_06025 [Nitrospirae bacterium]|nr:hypothetical protein [Nitrospirota bacterium]
MFVLCLQNRKGVIVMGIALFLMVLVFAGPLFQTPAFAADVTVIVTSRDLAEFSPQVIQVRSGSWVAWENRDGLMVHAIVMQKPTLREGDLAGTLEINADIAPNQSLNHQFRQQAHSTSRADIPTSAGSIPICGGWWW